MDYSDSDTDYDSDAAFCERYECCSRELQIIREQRNIIDNFRKNHFDTLQKDINDLTKAAQEEISNYDKYICDAYKNIHVQRERIDKVRKEKMSDYLIKVKEMSKRIKNSSDEIDDLKARIDAVSIRQQKHEEKLNQAAEDNKQLMIKCKEFGEHIDNVLKEHENFMKENNLII